VEEDLHCPDNFYCITPLVSKPGNCYEEDADGEINRSSIKYCPKGTQFPEYCPAGNQCEMPNTTESCTPSYYCPAGTAVEGLCPAGIPLPQIQPTCHQPSVSVRAHATKVLPVSGRQLLSFTSGVYHLSRWPFLSHGQ